MSSNKTIREELERLCGKGCFFKRAHIAERIEAMGGIKTYKVFVSEKKFKRKKKEYLAKYKDGIFDVIDEAYGDFSDLKPMRSFLKYFPRMIVLNTFSKAWASAAIRLGMAFASEEIIALFNKVKYPYNVNMLTQQAAQELLSQMVRLDRWTNEVRHERAQMIPCLMELPIVKQVYQSSANFLLVRVTDADAIYAYLVDNGIIVRNRNRVTMCQNALRITIGSKEENNELLGALRSYRR